MENLQKNWKTLNPQQLSKCMGGRDYIVVSYIDENGQLKFKIVAKG